MIQIKLYSRNGIRVFTFVPISTNRIFNHILYTYFRIQNLESGPLTITGLTKHFQYFLLSFENVFYTLLSQLV